MIIGALACSEGLKATGVCGAPLHQLLYMDCLELLPHSDDMARTPTALMRTPGIGSSRHDGLRTLLGGEAVEALQGAQVRERGEERKREREEGEGREREG